MDQKTREFFYEMVHTLVRKDLFLAIRKETTDPDRIYDFIKSESERLMHILKLELVGDEIAKQVMQDDQ